MRTGFARIAFIIGMAFMSLGVTAFASEKTVTLLVSLDPEYYPHGIAALLHDYSKVPAKLESQFRDGFKDTSYKVRVVQNASVYDLYEALHSPDSVGVFWVSHEAPVSWSKDPALSVSPPLTDVNRADVKAAFREINPAIHWVSLVACDSDLILNWLKNEQAQDPVLTNEAVQMQGFDHAIDVTQGLGQAINQGKAALSAAAHSDATDPSCPSASGIALRVTRSMSPQGAPARGGKYLFPALTVENRGEIIGVLPEHELASGDNASDTATVYVTGQSLDLTFQSGFDPMSIPAGFAMGDFSVEAGWEAANWQLFAKPDGTPFGAAQRTLLYKGPGSPALDSMTTYQPFDCN
jgi:hypothetical protein